jgi:hypothetical protein
MRSVKLFDFTMHRFAAKLAFSAKAKLQTAIASDQRTFFTPVKRQRL